MSFFYLSIRFFNGNVRYSVVHVDIITHPGRWSAADDDNDDDYIIQVVSQVIGNAVSLDSVSFPGECRRRKVFKISTHYIV